MLQRLWPLVFGGGLVAASFSGEAAPPPPKQPDWVLTLNARKALWNDPDFAELNLGVRVRNGEALVWGPVLTEAQAAEAIARLKLVAGIDSVVNETFILPANDVLRRKFNTTKPNALVTLGTKDEPAVKAIPSSTADLIDDVRRSDNRFFKLHITLNQGIADIEGATDLATANDFARRIRSLPGVTGVRIK